MENRNMKNFHMKIKHLLSFSWHVGPSHPGAQLQCPVTALHVAPLWHQQESEQPGPYLPAAQAGMKMKIWVILTK